MNSQTRLEAIKTIWIAFAVVNLMLLATTFSGSDGLGLAHLLFAVATSVAAALSTGFIAFGSSDSSDETAAAQSAKQKREERLSRLMAELSEEDLEALRLHLEAEVEPQYGLSSDGELRRR